MNICSFLCQNERPCGITVYANHVSNNIGSAAGAVCMTRRKTWHTVCLGREQARRSRGRSGRLRAVADARKRLHGASRPDIAGSGVEHGAIPLCESASAMPERQRRNGGCSLASLSAHAGCVRREDAVLRQQHGIAAEHTSGEEKANSIEDTRRSLTLQPTAFPEVESLLEGLRKRLRMPAAWAAKDGIQPGLTAVDNGKAVNERDVLILLT